MRQNRLRSAQDDDWSEIAIVFVCKYKYMLYSYLLAYLYTVCIFLQA